jgi:hypothetical protein
LTVVTVRYQGRMGNRLFQYCLGRIIAEHRGYALDAPPIEGFPATARTVGGARVRLPWRFLWGHRVDLARVLADPRRRRVVLRGYFLNWAYYREHADRLRAWLGYPADCGVAGEGDALVMIRLSDYQRCGGVLSWSYYELVLAQLRCRRLFFTTDQPDHPLAQRLARLGARRIDADPLATLRIGAACSTIVMSNSTYAWWLAFLGRPQEVWFPMANHIGEGAWALNRLADGVDLRIDEPAYRVVYNIPAGDSVEPRGRLVALDDAALAEVDPRRRPLIAAAAAAHRRAKAYLLV